MYRNRTAFGDIVIAHDEGVVVNSDARGQDSGWDMQQDQFAGIVINHPEDIAVTDTSREYGYDMQQDQFTGSDADVQGGDDGLGFAQAARLRHRIRRGGMRLGGPRVVRFRPPVGDTLYDPYGFGFRLRFPKIHIRVPKFIKKFQFGRFLGRTAIPFATGGVAGLLARKALPGLFSKVFHGGGGAQPSPDGAPDVAQPGGPAQPAAIVSTAPTPSVPAAPTATDSAGGALPADILAAIRGAISPAGGREGPTASEQTATAAEDAGGGQESGDVTPQRAGLGGVDLGGMMPMLLIGGGLLLASQLLPKRKRNRRRRR